MRVALASIVDALLAAGAKRDVTDPKGQTLTALAERWGKPLVAAHIAER
jgi:NAD(P)H-hydrate repair Nnr-like enzyme with NAD(P)H-hydrate epimerase domain